jgi:hypothetical protein
MKTLALLTVVMALVGCGGTSDDYDTERGRSRTNNNGTPQTYPRATDTNQTNQSSQSYPLQP